MKIGDKLYLLGSDNVNSKGLYMEKEIIGETKISWIVNDYGSLKINKKKLDYLPFNCSTRRQAFSSLEEINKIIWVERNSYRIMRATQEVKDYDILQQIAELINYKEQPCHD